MTAAKQIKKMRKDSSMTQKAFAEYFEVPRRTLEDWERGIRKPPEYLVRLMAYKLRMEGLIGKDGGSYEENG